MEELADDCADARRRLSDPSSGHQPQRPGRHNAPWRRWGRRRVRRPWWGQQKEEGKGRRGEENGRQLPSWLLRLILRQGERRGHRLAAVTWRRQLKKKKPWLVKECF